MGKKIDLTGQIFGRLTVLYELPERRNGKIYWHCKCECGKEKDIEGCSLRSGKTKSCGCYSAENLKDNNLDLTGQKFGYLTVLYKNGKTSKHNTIWHCKCKCGNEVDVITSSLRNGNTKSCGCLAVERGKENGHAKLKILPKGTRFGKLTVIKLLEERDINGKCIYQCQCDCGKIVPVLRESLVTFRTLSCGCLKKSRGEFIIEQILLQNNISFETQKTFKDCRNPETNFLLRFDFYINNQYLIEFDGIQHFQPTTFNGISKEEAIQNFNTVQKRDEIKNKYCLNNNIPLIRIPYTYLNKIKLEDLLPNNDNIFLIKKGEKYDPALCNLQFRFPPF